MENLSIYERSRVVPENAKKPIAAGRLKGFTDINPMWRIKKLTEMFGPCGLGWYYKEVNRTVEYLDKEAAAFVDIELYVKYGDTWSQPICGTGGSMLIANEKNGLRLSDEAFKMATTDAISVACKNLGIGADVYWDESRTKYTAEKPAEQRNATPAPYPTTNANVGREPMISQRQIDYIRKMGYTGELDGMTMRAATDLIGKLKNDVQR